MGLSVLTRNIYPKGMIAYYGLSDWWLTLTKEQRNSFRKMYEYALGCVPDDMDITDYVIMGLRASRTRYQFLAELASWSTDDNLKIPLIEWAITETIEARNYTELHFTYMIAWKHFKRLTKDDLTYADMLIDYLQKDMALYDNFVEFCKAGGLGRNAPVPRYPAFKELALIYERLGRYQDALDVVNDAMAGNVNEGSSWVRRKAKLEKKVKD
jgi:tetratricopeptide (TPR) repeat protein